MPHAGHRKELIDGNLECKEQEPRILELVEHYGPTLIETEVGGATCKTRSLRRYVARLSIFSY